MNAFVPYEGDRGAGWRVDLATCYAEKGGERVAITDEIRERIYRAIQLDASQKTLPGSRRRRNVKPRGEKYAAQTAPLRKSPGERKLDELL